MNLLKGSEWRKWDLHVHSPASEGYTGSWDQFETQLKNTDCAVIGINDYFSVDGYKKIKEKIDNGTLNIGDKKILPVVEFRMTESIQNKNTTTNGASHFNFHIIFDDTINIDDIENLIKGLTSGGTKISTDYNDKSKLKDKKVPLDSLLNELNKDIKFKDKFLLWLPYDEYGGIDEIDPNSDEWIKSNYIKNADILGSSRQKQIDFFIWKSDLKTNGTVKFTQDQFRTWFLRKKACIKGSDSHEHTYPIGKLRDENSKPIEKYCWIKADPTFEGLKQVTYDPESRLCIGTNSPVEPTNIVEKLNFNIPKTAKLKISQQDGSTKEDLFCFADINKEYYLSPFLNCFVGGRGSGKSTILNFLGQYSENPSSSTKFWKKINPNFSTQDKKTFSFDGVETFEYIGQSEVESFATNKETFTNAIYERANIIGGGILAKQEEKLTSDLGDLEKFKELIQSLSNLKNQKSNIEKEKKTLDKSIKITESEEYSEIIGRITLKSNQKQALERWREVIEGLRESVDEVIENHFDYEEDSNGEKEEDLNDTPNTSEVTKLYEEVFEAVQKNITSAKDLLNEDNFSELITKENNLSEEIKKDEIALSKLLEKAGLSEENIIQVKNAPQRLVRINDHTEKIDKRIKENEKEIAKYETQLKTIEKNKSDYEEKIVDSIKPLNNTLEEQAKENDKQDIKNIGLQYFFDEDLAWKNIAEEFYNFFVEEFSDGERSDSVKDFITKNKESFSKTSVEIDDLLKGKDGSGYIKFLREVFTNKSNYQIFEVIRDTHLNNVSEYKRIQVLYDGKDIERASFGQRCTAVIVILLLFGNYPLIIDEPEAHLDSSLIANYLVPLIKRKKTNRQIIFATHNANFVINGDSEKIFILNNETGSTQIIETTIENLVNRDHLLKLEGGREAFKKRGEKLHI